MSLSAGELVADRFRQIHLDFHTAPQIPDVGVDFDPDQFAGTLQEAGVNWVTLFGKCHHGMSYYPTKAGVVHPSLQFDLLGAQIEACKKRDIVTPVYISVRVDQHMGITRSDLVVRLEDGKLWGPSASQASWYQMCLGNKEYIDYVAAQTEEVLRGYDADGIFYDMCYYPPDPGCFCEKCLARLGTKRANRDAHRRQTYEILRGYTTRLAKLCKDLRPNATTFFNSRVTPNVHRELDVLTQLEIESLTTGGWGYHYFPTYSRMLRTYDRPVQGMTARFHKSWADFGGLKTVPQLKYEAATILAAGGVVNIGDQLHPRGTLDKGAYGVIGEVYRDVAAAEPFCRDAQPLVDIAVLLLPESPEAASGDIDSRGAVKIGPSIEGAAATLTALKHQWNGETPDRDNLSSYKLLIIPDRGYLDSQMTAKVVQYHASGGAILFTHEATLDNDAFAMPNCPVKYIGPCPYTPSYMKFGGDLGNGLPDTEFVNYRAGSYVEPISGSTPLGEVWKPYFNREPGRFSSHAQTPVDSPTGHPIGVVSQDQRIGYLYAAVFQGYRDDAFYIYKEMVQRMISRLLPEPIIKTISNVPASMEISVLRQAKQNRTVVHLVAFTPQRRTATSEFIEDSVPVCDVEFGLRTGSAPTRVALQPRDHAIDFRMDGNYCIVTIRRVVTHQIITFEGV